MFELDDQGLGCETVSPSNIRSYIHQNLTNTTTQMDTNKHAKIDRKRTIRPQSHSKNHGQLRRAGSRRGGLPQGRTHQYTVHCQMVSPEKTHVGDIILTQQVIFANVSIHVTRYI